MSFGRALGGSLRNCKVVGIAACRPYRAFILVHHEKEINLLLLKVVVQFILKLCYQLEISLQVVAEPVITAPEWRRVHMNNSVVWWCVRAHHS